MSASRRRFKIIKEIAEGGFGKVYLAEQISSDGTFSRIVAIKLLHAKWSSHDEVVKRTRDEARVLGRIRHQHIVKVEDLTSIEGKCAIVMEYLEGVDLKWMAQFLKERKLHFPRAALFEIVLAVASALDAAYSGIPLQGDQPLKAIHRDIKPSNIFVTVAGGVKVLDFGTARANFAEREAKTQALAFGSQGYMAPERMLGEEDTPAADVFSLGITLYELLTLESFGRIPPRPNKFNKKMDERVAAVPLEGDADWVQQVRDTLRLMLSYAPADRPSAAQLVEIMDLLAQDANDTGLRRYCRTLVQEAKDALPAPENADSLIGTIVDEDDSASGPTPSRSEAPHTVEIAAASGSTSAEFLDPPRQSSLSRPGGAVSTPAPPDPRGAHDRAEGPETVFQAGVEVAPPTRGRSLSGTAAAPPPPQNVRTVVPRGEAAGGNRASTPSAGFSRSTAPAPPSEAATVLADPGSLPLPPSLQPGGSTEAPKGSGPTLPPTGTAPPAEARSGVVPTVLGVGLATLTAVGVIGGFALVLVIAIVVIALRSGGDPPVAVPGDDDVPTVTAGGTILSPDGRADATRIPTVLEYATDGGAEIELTGPGGFRARWDGRAPFDLGPTGEGEYKANVTPPGAAKIRLKRFVVDPKKKQCRFKFDPAAEEWLGGCT